MVRHLAEGITDTLNVFPSKNGITETISEATIIEGKLKMGLQRKKIVLGSHALVYTGTTNTNKPRAVPSVALLRQNNTRGIIS